jgi:putative transport protein
VLTESELRITVSCAIILKLQIILSKGEMNMKFDLIGFLTNPFVPMFLAVVTGLFIGKIKIGKFSLGQSGGLFTGIVIGWGLYSKYVVPYLINPAAPEKGLVKNAPKFATAYFKSNGLYESFFTFTLILFIAAVGLLAAKDLGKVIRKYGAKFIVMGAVTTGTGALVTYIATKLFQGQNHFAVAGVYTGALTSSPGLAAALEAVAKYGAEAQAQVGLGHAIGYAPGVITIIIVMNFFPVIFRMDMDKEKARFAEEMGSYEKNTANAKEKNIKEVAMDVLSFAFVCLAGYAVGCFSIYLPLVKWFSLGSTGGVLIMSLLLGHIGKIGPLTFRMSSTTLSAIRDVALSLFLAIVGLEYGYAAISALGGSGATLALISFGAAFCAYLAAYLVGRYVFKMNWIILSGAMCGGATSTPGIGAAISSTGTDEVAAGYGATYPFALICKVIFVIILHMFT